MGSFLSGAGLGLVLAVTAVGGAAYAHWKALPARQALAVIVSGMLVRMLVLGLWAGIGFAKFELEPLSFLGGFAATYLVGQVAEIVLLVRDRKRGPA